MALTKVRGAGAEGLTLSTTDLKIDSGDLVFSTADKGVVLGATSNTDANTISDYEEGTFTPTLSTDSTYSGDTDVGEYTKIGDMVYVVIRYQKSGTINSGSNARHSLPFTSKSGSFQNSCFRGNVENIDTSVAGVGGVAGADQSILYLQELTLQTTTPTLSGNDLGTGFQIQISGFYKAT